MPPTANKPTWHGFSDWLSFVRATVALLFPILGGMWALGAWGVEYLRDEADDRYVQHADLQAAVTDIKSTIKDSARQVQCEALLDDIQRLEQTIAFKARTGEDASLEKTILDSDKRKLTRYNGCPQ